MICNLFSDCIHTAHPDLSLHGVVCIVCTCVTCFKLFFTRTSTHANVNSTCSCVHARSQLIFFKWFSFKKYLTPLCTVLLLQSLRLLLCASWQQPFGASGNRSSVGTKPLANGTLHTPLVTLLSLLVYDLVLWTIRLLRRQYGFDVSSKESLIISQSLTCWWL